MRYTGQEGKVITKGMSPKMERNLKVAKERLGDMQEKAVERTRAAAKATDHYVHEHPWQAIGVAAAIGVVIGLLLNRR